MCEFWTLEFWTLGFWTVEKKGYLDEALNYRWTLEILQVLKCEEEWTDKVIVDAVEGTHSHFVSGGRTNLQKPLQFTHPSILHFTSV